MDVVTFLGILVVTIGLLFVYSRTWRHPQGFTNAASARSTAPPPSKEIPVEQDIDKPYLHDPISSIDDYEYSLIFKNEGDRAMTKATRDTLMSQYPMDWSVQPPSSTLFQNGLAAFKEAFANPVPPPKGPSPYTHIDGSSMIPPDSSAEEQKEREILQTYTPKDPKSLTTYDAADAAELIAKIYDAKGLVPQWKETGPNQYTILSTMKKGEEIVYEDDPKAVASSGPVTQSGEGTIIVPALAAEVQRGKDPFFTQSSRVGKWDYTSWTPGLERMFAPTEPQTHWY